MCISLKLKVERVMVDKAMMEDGREVRIGLIKDVQIGDFLEVYGDVALGKLAKRNIKDRFPLSRE